MEKSHGQTGEISIQSIIEGREPKPVLARGPNSPRVLSSAPHRGRGGGLEMERSPG